MYLCVCEHFPQWPSSGLPLLIEQGLILPAFVVCETERHSRAEDLASGTEKAMCMRLHTREHKCMSCFLPVSVCVYCPHWAGQFCSSLFG